MALMILAHPRSKSTLLAECFQGFMGEIFNITIVDKKTFKMIDNPVPDSTPSNILWQQDWTSQYLKHLEEVLTGNDKAVFKVFYEHIIFSEAAQQLIQRLHPRIISIHRLNELKAIKSHLLAGKRGFSVREQKSIAPFAVTPAQFFYSYRVCVALPKLARSIFDIQWSTTYEDFDPAQLTGRDRTPAVTPQNSEEVFHYIINEAEVDGWYHALKV